MGAVAPGGGAEGLVALRRERFLDAMTDALVRLRLRHLGAAKGLAPFTAQSGHAPGPEGPEGVADDE